VARNDWKLEISELACAPVSTPFLLKNLSHENEFDDIHEIEPEGRQIYIRLVSHKDIKATAHTQKAFVESLPFIYFKNFFVPKSLCTDLYYRNFLCFRQLEQRLK